jgi:hypothetical protein
MLLTEPADTGASLGPQRCIPVERALAGYCRERKIRFLVQDEPESSLRILMPDAFLPALALHAEACALELLQPKTITGRPMSLSGVFERLQGQAHTLPLGTHIKEDPEALLGLYASVPALTGDGFGSLRAALFVHALHKVFGYAADSSIEVSGIFAKYAGQGVKGILEGIEKPPLEVSWPPATPH